MNAKPDVRIARLQRVGDRLAVVLRALWVALRRFRRGFKRQPPPEGIEWALRSVPLHLCTANFLVLGSPGSGKTILVRLLLQSLLPRFCRASGEDRSSPPPAPTQRAIIYDAKLDMLAFLEGIVRSLPAGLQNLFPDVIITNAFDARCQGWDLARDVDSPEDVRYLVAALFPRDGNAGTSFWGLAAQEITRAVVLSLVFRKVQDWTLRDIIIICRSLDLIRQVTKDCPEACGILESCLNDTNDLPGVLATLSTKLSRYEDIAAIWHNLPVTRRFSVHEWYHRGGILLFGSHPRFADALGPLNEVMLKLAVDELLAGPETRLPHTWFILDGFRWLGRAETVRRVLDQGHSQGGAVVLGIQDVSELISDHGEQEADEMLDRCAHKVFMHAGPATAEWAARHFGEFQLTLDLGSDSGCIDPQGHCSSSQSWGEHILVALRYRASAFTALPLAGPSTGFLSFIADSPWGGIASVRVPWPEVHDRLIAPSWDTGFQPHGSSDIFRLAPWSEASDAERMQLGGKARFGTRTPGQTDVDAGGADSAATQPPPDIAERGLVQPDLPDLSFD